MKIGVGEHIVGGVQASATGTGLYAWELSENDDSVVRVSLRRTVIRLSNRGGREGCAFEGESFSVN